MPRRFKWSDERGPHRKTLLKTYSQETFERLRAENRLISPIKPGAKYSYEQYLKESSGVRQIGDMWDGHEHVESCGQGATWLPDPKTSCLV